MNNALYFFTTQVNNLTKPKVSALYKQICLIATLIIMSLVPFFSGERYFPTFPAVDNTDIFVKFHFAYQDYDFPKEAHYKPAVIKQIIRHQIHKNERPKSGIASIYSSEFEGRMMANGRTFQVDRDTVASLVFPIGSKLKITNLRNHTFVYAINTDRMAPGMLKKGRIIDLSPHLASMLGFHDGLARVSVEQILNKHNEYYKLSKELKHVRKYHF